MAARGSVHPARTPTGVWWPPHVARARVAPQTSVVTALRASGGRMTLAEVKAHFMLDQGAPAPTLHPGASPELEPCDMLGHGMCRARAVTPPPSQRYRPDPADAAVSSRGRCRLVRRVSCGAPREMPPFSKLACGCGALRRQ
eukprot:5171383-Prymnesium_polylepis.1